ncbi:MAG: hypothetical protein ABI416_17935 [Ginsengibacter sp.]
MKNIELLLISCLISISVFGQANSFNDSKKADTFNNHIVLLDDHSKIISWITPQSKAYDQFLRQRWNFIKTMVPFCPGPAPRSLYPQYYFYCAYRYKAGQLEPDTWMNDVGEKLPNWFESARLYYAYTGDTSVMNIVRNFIDYSMEHGRSPSGFSWPDFPYTTTNAGDTEFRGFTSSKRFVLHEVQVDHAGDIGLTYYKLYLYTGDNKYKTAAIKMANTLASKVRTGSATQSPWPYRVVLNSGKITAEYGANWAGCYTLLDDLVKANLGNVAAYRAACKKVKDFILQFPMKTGYWTDGHTDADVNSNTYKSNMSASNISLYILDHPEFDPGWKSDLPMLIKWTEDNFIFRTAPGEPASQWGANIVGEQDSFIYKMDYQTARYGAQCARWYAISGDETYKDKAYRSLNWVTYCNDSNGMANESPLSKDISNWWSDCYGEGPRMFYHAFAAVPEWAPPAENHILYSKGVLKNVGYQPKKIQYIASDDDGIDYLRVAFKPSVISLNGVKISLHTNIDKEGYILKSLGNGDYAVTIKRRKAGNIVIRGL